MKALLLMFCVLVRVAALASGPTQQQTTDTPDVRNETVTPADSPKQSVPTAAEESRRQQTRRSDKQNVDAIGNRQVGGRRGLGNWYSLDSEVRLGARMAAEVNRTTRMVQNAMVAEYINRVAQKLARNSDVQFPITVAVIDSPDIRAFALPGGFLYVDSGLIVEADSEAELAGAIAHELAHVAAHHFTRDMTRSKMAGIASVALVLFGGAPGYAIAGGANMAFPFSAARSSRQFEREADYLGLQYLYKAGYDPTAFISFCERIRASQAGKPGKLERVFSPYPQASDRILQMQKEIANVLPQLDEYVITTSEFDDAKHALIGPPVLMRGQSDMPKLRRRPQ